MLSPAASSCAPALWDAAGGASRGFAASAGSSSASVLPPRSCVGVFASAGFFGDC
jgi:hypothetical protein